MELQSAFVYHQTSAPVLTFDCKLLKRFDTGNVTIHNRSNSGSLQAI